MRVDYKYDNYHTITSQFSSNVNIQSIRNNAIENQQQNTRSSESEESSSPISEESSDAPLHLQKRAQQSAKVFNVPQR